MTLKTWRAWTNKQEEHLADLRGQGLSIAACASALGRTVASVKGRLLVLDAPKHWPRRMDYLVLLAAGLSERQIALRLGVSKWAVKHMKQRLRRRGG
jgi:DNA-binding CsgD family transcriptional regulator